jgi:hypothetical protein
MLIYLFVQNSGILQAHPTFQLRFRPKLSVPKLYCRRKWYSCIKEPANGDQTKTA